MVTFACHFLINLCLLGCPNTFYVWSLHCIMSLSGLLDSSWIPVWNHMYIYSSCSRLFKLKSSLSYVIHTVECEFVPVLWTSLHYDIALSYSSCIYWGLLHHAHTYVIFYLHIWSFTVFWFAFCLPGRHICMDFIRISGLFYMTHCFNRYKGTILKEQFKFYPLSLSLIVWWWWITSLSSSKDLGPNNTKGVRENWHHHPIQICRGHF